MRLLAILLLPAFIGLINAQWGGMNGQNGFQNGYADQGRHPGGSSKQINPWDGQGQGYGWGLQGYTNQLNQQNVGHAPQNQQGGSSGPGLFDFGPANNQPINSNVNHQNVGQAPLETGGNSQGMIIPDGPVQTGMRDQVNMVNAGQGPAPGETGNSPNSGENFLDTGFDTGAGYANNAPQRNPGQSSNNNNQVAYAAGAGGSSGGAGPAYAAGNGDNTGGNAPLGGALLTDLNQQDAGTAEHSRAAASVGPTVAGVVIAVLVLVGVVAVAAVFLVKQRASRMMVQSV